MTTAKIRVQIAVVMALMLPRAAIASEAPPLQVRGFATEHLFHDKLPGSYNKVYDAFLEGYDRQVTLTFSPPRRTMREFLVGNSDCIFMAAEEVDILVQEPEQKFLHSKVFNVISIDLFGNSNQPMPLELQDIAGEVIAIPATTLPIIEALNGGRQQEFQFLPTNDFAEVFELLAAGRVRYAIGIEQDGIDALGPRFLKDFQKGIELAEVNETMSCWKNSKSEHFIKHIDHRIETLQKEGFFRKLFP